VSEELTDPSKAAHQIVKVLEDGDAIRNDGVLLQAANKNPWYVLATIYGEQEEGATPWEFDEVLAEKNRWAWNGWYCGGLSGPERKDRADKIELKQGDFAPLTDAEVAALTKKLRARLNDQTAELPAVTESIDFSEVYFSRFVSFEKYVCEKYSDFRSATFRDYADFRSTAFSGDADFRSATFIGDAYFRSATFSSPAYFSSATFSGETYFNSTMFSGYADFNSAMFIGDAYFRSATFIGDAYFRSATFSGPADFSSATLSGPADFSSAMFSGDADFSSATFSGDADFSSAMFSGDADFSSAMFSGNTDFSWHEDFEGKKEQHPARFFQAADFSSAKFKSTTRFTDALFYTSMPQFHATDLYDDTVFAARNQDLGNWPPLHGAVKVKGCDKPIEVMDAEEQKRAYNRLRLFMNRSLQIEEEQFFHRMEMRCKAVLAKWHHKPLYWLFAVFSDYGNSVWRPIAWGALSVITAALYMLWWQGVFTFTPQEAGMDWTFGLLADGDVWAKPREAFGWSISNTLPFIGTGNLYYGGEFAKELAWPLRVVGGVQTLFGFILLFLLGLGLRNRFRLR